MTEPRATRAVSLAEEFAQALAGREPSAVSRDKRRGCQFVDGVGEDGEYGWLCWDESGDIGNWVEFPDTGQTADQVLAEWEREQDG